MIVDTEYEIGKEEMKYDISKLIDELKADNDLHDNELRVSAENNLLNKLKVLVESL